MGTYIHTSRILTAEEKQQVKTLIDDNCNDEAERLLHDLADDRVICLRSGGWEYLFNLSDDYHDFESFKEWFLQDSICFNFYDWDANGKFGKVSKEAFLADVAWNQRYSRDHSGSGYVRAEGMTFTTNNMQD